MILVQNLGDVFFNLDYSLSHKINFRLESLHLIGNIICFSELKRRKYQVAQIMGLMFLKKFSLLFLLIFGSLLSTSCAGRRSKLIRNFSEEYVNAILEGTPRKPLNKEEVRSIHERLLRVNTKDYGRYDPSPSLSKPPFKLIPN
ncbi:hypothetical protein VNO77_39448 [Canavalia gladiata]|uniref:Protein CASPARIAN STRIP INTEGRITY FACTOR 1 n=1 Tax=Canavalia gladiata TaxID=3824 RepID=A0AAN9KB36_CANGL